MLFQCYNIQSFVPPLHGCAPYTQAANQAIINGLRRTLERTHQRVEDLRNFRSVIFQGVFSHRFR